MCDSDGVIEVPIKHLWLRSGYTALVHRSRLLAGVAIVVSLLSNVLTELTAVAVGADFLALLFLFILYYARGDGRGVDHPGNCNTAGSGSDGGVQRRDR